MGLDDLSNASGRGLFIVLKLYASFSEMITDAERDYLQASARENASVVISSATFSRNCEGETCSLGSVTVGFCLTVSPNIEFSL